MTLQEKIKKDLSRAMKEKDDVRKEALRVILGEMGRYEKKEVPDEDAVKILKKLLKSEKELLEKTGGAQESDFSRVVEGYLPQMATDQEIIAWIRENIDFSQYKNKMQAMGTIMKHFGAAADGIRVRELLQSL